jgi:nucleoside-diphosphate-sugar epimerase
MRVALTGATGYTGGRLLRALRGRGDEVAALARPASVTGALRESGARVVEGDLRDEGALSRLVEGSDAVLHVAAVYRTAGHPDGYYHEVNVAGTERLLEAAARAGVRRFVHTSTVGVHGHIEAPPADETAPFAPGDVYQDTKAAAETLALDFGGKRAVRYREE